MKSMSHAALWLIPVCALPLASCNPSAAPPQSTVKAVAASPDVRAADAKPTPHRRLRGGTDPDDAGVGQDVRDALLGLTFDSGYVEVNPAAGNAPAGGVPGDGGQPSADSEAQLGLEAFAAGQLAEAAEHQARAIVLDPQRADTFEQLAATIGAAGLVEETAAAYRTTLQLDPSREESRYRLGMLAQVRS